MKININLFNRHFFFFNLFRLYHWKDMPFIGILKAIYLLNNQRKHIMLHLEMGYQKKMFYLTVMNIVIFKTDIFK